MHPILMQQEDGSYRKIERNLTQRDVVDHLLGFVTLGILPYAHGTVNQPISTFTSREGDYAAIPHPHLSYSSAGPRPLVAALRSMAWLRVSSPLPWEPGPEGTTLPRPARHCA